MAIKKKKVVEKTIEEISPVEEAKETAKPIATPKEEVKQWTYDELILLPREEYLSVKQDIRSGKAKIKID